MTEVIFLGVVIILIPLLLDLLNIPSIVIPSELFETLSNGTIGQVFNTINYVMPVSFGLSCLLLVILVRHFHLLWNFATWIIERIRS